MMQIHVMSGKRKWGKIRVFSRILDFHYRKNLVMRIENINMATAHYFCWWIFYGVHTMAVITTSVISASVSISIY